MHLDPISPHPAPILVPWKAVSCRVMSLLLYCCVFERGCVVC